MAWGFSHTTLNEWLELWKKVTRPKEDLDIVVYPVRFKVEMEKAKLTEYFV